jgi:hypothetical protein
MATAPRPHPSLDAVLPCDHPIGEPGRGHGALVFALESRGPERTDPFTVVPRASAAAS